MTQQNSNSRKDNLSDDAAEPENQQAAQPAQGFADELAAAEGPAQAGPETRIAALETQLAESKDQMLRAMAEAENTRKRLLREREDVRKYAVADFARDMLEFAENFRRALASIPSESMTDPAVKNVAAGIETMEKELHKTMEKHGIKKIDPLDTPFDANFHEAMFEAPGTGKPGGTVIQVIEPGYVLHDRLLRPARVGIAKSEGPGAATPGGHVDTQA